MENLGDNHHAPTTEAALRFLIIRTQVDSTLQAVTDDARKARLGLRGARDAYAAAVDASRAATAAVRYGDVRLDRCIKVELQAAVDNLLAPLPEKTRKAKKANVFGGKSPSVGMKPTGGAVQGQYVADVLAQLAAPEWAPIAAVTTKATKLRGNLEAAESARTAARTAEELARTALDDAVTAAQKVYNEAAPRLTLLLGDDPDFVESCFLDLRNETDDQSAEARKRVLLAVYRARFGAVPREVQKAVEVSDDEAAFEKLVELFATKSAEEIAAAVGVKGG